MQLRSISEWGLQQISWGRSKEIYAQNKVLLVYIMPSQDIFISKWAENPNQGHENPIWQSLLGGIWPGPLILIK